MVRRRAANVSGAVIDENTGSSLYSRIGTTHRSMPCLRISAGRNVSSRFLQPLLLHRRLLAQRAERPFGRTVRRAVREAE